MRPTFKMSTNITEEERCLNKLLQPKTAAKFSTFKQLTAAFSAEATPVLEDKLPRFRTSENNPKNHNEVHCGKFYTINPEVKKTLFHHGGITRLLNLQMETFREACIMVRNPALEILDYLKNLNYSFPAARFVLYGENGVGKSATLIHLLHYGYNEKFLLLHVPWVSNWTRRPKEVVPSQVRPERVDLPVESLVWLQHFKLQNLELLKNLDLKTSRTYTWSQREVTEEGKPLIDVIDHGLNRGNHASDCVAVLLKEIKEQSSSGKFKTLVVVDGVNGFFSTTCTHYFTKSDKSLMVPDDITIVHAFLKVLNNDWNNAAVITAVDSIIENRDEKITIPFTPRALLGKEGFELLDPFIPVEVENYTEKEADSLLDYYTDRQWLQLEEARSEKGRSELKFLSGLNPYMLMKYCDSL